MLRPQRFERVPSEDPSNDQGVPLDDYMDRSKINAEDNSGPGNSHPRNMTTRSEGPRKRPLGARILGSFYDKYLSGWRSGLIRSFILSLVTVVTLIAVYVWLYKTYTIHGGTATIKSGSCRLIQGTNTGVHGALNVVSTLILGASTYVMQGMTAPSRKEVDAAHAKGKWVEIGSQSLRNLFYVHKRNTWIWAVLFITGVPFHLFFNAVFFTSTQANQYAVAVVDESILRNTAFQPTLNNTWPGQFPQRVPVNEVGGCANSACSFDRKDNSTVLELIQNITNSSSTAGFKRMEPLECIRSYSSSFIRGYGDVVLVSPQSDANSPVLFTRYPQRFTSPGTPETNRDPYHWVCSDVLDPNGEHDRCSLKLAEDRFDSGRNWTVYKHPVSYCLAREVPDTCQLHFNVWIMLLVVLCAGIKTIVNFFVLFMRPVGRILRTLGDGIASFLEEEDSTTRNMSLISSKQIRRHGFQSSFEPQIYTGLRARWLTSANTTEFFTTIGVSALYIIILAIALFFAIDGAHGAAFSNGLGVADIQSLASFQADDTGSSGIVPTLLIANIPQLGFSLFFVIYTTIWSKLLVALEFDHMTRTHKGLRVSERPRHHQRGTHYFSLPVRYALPLMACGAMLHWLCSQAFFMVRIDGVDAHANIDDQDRLVRLGYSTVGIISLIALAFAMLIGTVCIAWFKRLNTSLGEVGMSIVLSAACHLSPYEPASEPWLEQVQWGDVSGDVRMSSGYREQDERVRHVCFTAGEPGKLVVGERYS